MKLRLVATLTLLAYALPIHALESVPKPEYRTRRGTLAEKMSGGIAVLFAAEEPILDFMPYRQDEDFYYLTGWNEPGAALVVVAATPSVAATDITTARAAQPYREILFLPARNMRTEKYTGAKMDASTSGVAASTGVDEVLPMSEMPAILNGLVAIDRTRFRNIWTEQDSKQAKAFLTFTASTLGLGDAPEAHDLSGLTMELRAVKSPEELALMKKAANASIASQLAEMRAVQPGVTERKVAGVIIEKLMEEGCERVSYAPIVGSGKNATTLHYSENSATMKAGDVVVIDAAGEYSMYASDITRTLPIDGHFTPRQREIYDLVLGAQRAAAAAFVAGKSKINDPQHKEPDSLDTVAYNYINAHGKDLRGQPLGQYMVHGIGHLIGIDVHDPWDYTKPLEKGMAFTIEPGIYLPEERIGVRIEDVFYVDEQGKLVDLIAKLPHEAADVEAAMKR
ncbi:aminopeptidase P N-terminal domain-containing protein [Granulicella arctica]|uniref:Xaa-Pro aminopeptidase n=1 Tax=Granulicella arctica TaxID=940613 RepID=A0A7Y9PK34_9BACT|nr:aminopeptidase P N-terminal domain-containing protein [Granulicella arctica]NYF81383.1 Xaa-Pro aminopeptidase [Granulicella arctica]